MTRNPTALFTLAVTLLAAPAALATDPIADQARDESGEAFEHQNDAVDEWVPVAPGSPIMADAQRDTKRTWDLLGVQFDAQAGHTLVFLGPRYQAFTKPGLYIDAQIGLGVTNPARDGAPVFLESEAYAGWALGMGRKARPSKFNVGQKTANVGGDTMAYSYETTVMAQRHLVAYGGVRSFAGHGPDLVGGGVAPGYFALAGGIAKFRTWREVQHVNGLTRTLRGVEGWDMRVYFAPQNSDPEGFSNFKHFGGEVRIHRTAEIGKGATPFHLGIGIEPGLGGMIRMGMMFPVATPMSGKLGKTGEFLR
ncbi:MAG: hypothetical protein EP330_16315 [Deltaproteobacteria bacterium]|nr:MAG: hypothetical protein EP330_16315 [Deltaproteobacteria bacterium]